MTPPRYRSVSENLRTARLKTARQAYRATGAVMGDIVTMTQKGYISIVPTVAIAHSFGVNARSVAGSVATYAVLRSSAAVARRVGEWSGRKSALSNARLRSIDRRSQLGRLRAVQQSPERRRDRNR